jgi:hypothetical protein
MYGIAATSYGFYVTFEGTLSESEMAQFAAELDSLRPGVQRGYSAVIDVRRLIPPEANVLDLLHKALVRGKENGVGRVAIVGSSPVIKNQAVQLAFLSDLESIVRYFNASKMTDWEKICFDWVINGIEPTADIFANAGKIHIG